MRVLLTNDDSINAAGLHAAHSALSGDFSLCVVAPEAEQSAIGHGITLSKPLRVKPVHKDNRFFGSAVDGTPADCVKIAVRALMKEPPDLIVSGINHGPNLGADVLYSGTVSAASEGTILGIPSIAFSLTAYDNHDFSVAQRVVRYVVGKMSSLRLPAGTLLNVNIPALPRNRLRGIKITQQGMSAYTERFVQRTDPRGRQYYWLTGKVRWLAKPPHSDIKAIQDGYVSITPLQLDLTDYNYLDALRAEEFTLP